MARTQLETGVQAHLLKVGSEVVPIYGDDKSGWSFEPGILAPRMAIYRTVDELFFALLNMNLAPEGSA